MAAAQIVPNSHLEFYLRDVTDGVRSPWKKLVDESDEQHVVATQGLTTSRLEFHRRVVTDGMRSPWEFPIQLTSCILPARCH